MAARSKTQRRQAGQKGGATTKARYGHEHFKEAGKRGGTTTRERHGLGHFRAAAKRGGAVTAGRHGKEHYRKLAALGAKARAARNAVLPELLVALEPFMRFLEETEKSFERLGAKGLSTEKAASGLSGVTVGACLNLLKQTRLAKEKILPVTFADGGVKMKGPFPGDSPQRLEPIATKAQAERAYQLTGQRLETYPDALGFKVRVDESKPARELTFEPDEGALPPRGGE